jgi:hypothetical protein
MPFKSVGFERTWWKLIQKRVARIKFDIYVFTKTGEISCIWVLHTYEEILKCLYRQINDIYNHSPLQLM